MTEQTEIYVDEFELLDQRERSLLLALIQTGSVRAAAKAAGIPERTAYAMVQRPAFQSARKAVGRYLLTNALLQVQAATSTAVQVLSDIAQNTQAHNQDRVAAARTLLDQARRLSEVTDMMELERQIEQLQNEYGNAQ